MGIKVALIGAGSMSFGPASVRDVLLSEALAEQGVELVLMDIAADHLPRIADYAERAAGKLGREARITATTELDRALDGASFAVTAVEVDRFKYWTQDFHIPRKHGFRHVFGENGGIGGLFHALRNMGPMIEIARTMERLCPDAWLLNYANPEHKLCEAVSRLTSIRNTGLCHGVFMGQNQIAMILGRRVEELEMAACGINHFTWFQTIRDKKTGEDLYPALRAAEQEGDWLHDWHELGLSRILFRRFGLWPCPGPNHFGEYLGWADEFVCSELQFFHDPADGKPWETGNTPEFIYSLGHHPTGRPWRTEKPELPVLATDTLEPSGELAAPIMESIACGVRHSLDAVNLPNRGAIPNLPDDMVVEAPAVGGADGLEACPMAPLPEAIAAMLRTQGSINQLLVEAFAERSKDKLIQAALLDPTVGSYRRAIECIDELLELQRDLLPSF